VTKALTFSDGWFAGGGWGVSARRKHRVFVETSGDFKRATAWLINAGVTQIAAITGIDQGETIEILHHLTHGGYVISLRSRVLKAAPEMPSVVDLLPGSALFEREVHDMFGVTFHGNPDLSPLLLPDGWPRDVYPMRSEWTTETLRERLEDR
jgi:NADH-quinone oxidoreductase subunit C